MNLGLSGTKSIRRVFQSTKGIKKVPVGLEPGCKKPSGSCNNTISARRVVGDMLKVERYVWHVVVIVGGLRQNDIDREEFIHVAKVKCNREF